MSESLKTHHVTLRGPRVTLRPLAEQDWPVLERWNADPEVLRFAESEDRKAWTPEEVRTIYRTVSQTAFCFLIEAEGRPIGEGWLQRMNLPELNARHPGRDLRRIDLMIGEKPVWGKGCGAETIALLTRFGFEVERADRIYGCGIWSQNPRSLVAFAKNGFEIEDSQPVEGHGGVGHEFNLSLEHAPWAAFHAGPHPLRVRKAGPPDADTVLALLVEAAEWLRSRGIRQWEAIVTERERTTKWIAARIAAEAVWIAELEGQVAGGFWLSEAEGWDREVWSDASPAERYVGKLAIRRSFAGRGLGLRLLRRAEVLAVAQGAAALRLDCVADGPLADYYTRAGYTPQGVVEAHGWRLARFERRLAG